MRLGGRSSRNILQEPNYPVDRDLHLANHSYSTQAKDKSSGEPGWTNQPQRGYSLCGVFVCT
jgi:hypothetical protein